MHRGLAVFIAVVVVCGGGIVAYAVGDLATRPISYEWLLFLALTVASDLATLRSPGMPISFSISDIFSIASALVFGPAAGAVTAADVVDGVELDDRAEGVAHRAAEEAPGDGVTEGRGRGRARGRGHERRG